MIIKFRKIIEDLLEILNVTPLLKAHYESIIEISKKKQKTEKNYQNTEEIFFFKYFIINYEGLNEQYMRTISNYLGKIDNNGKVAENHLKEMWEIAHYFRSESTKRSLIDAFELYLSTTNKPKISNYITNFEIGKGIIINGNNFYFYLKQEGTEWVYSEQLTLSTLLRLFFYLHQINMVNGV